MSVVGLSFGSPTSGTGFDVSTTVSEIVANLENVETPWKTQLTTLESQDTAISSLGTLLSTLSTDMSSLTDATGMLSEKEGSSSNTDVLELTAASTSAVAGTHTVLVSALAATSSGYLTEVSDSSDTLSGSIVIKVGSSGTAHTITLDSSDDTLSGLASAINSAGIGVTASVLTDSSGSRLSLVSGTSGADGDIYISGTSPDKGSSTTSGITDTTTGDALNYTTSTAGADGSLTVDGVSLTTSSNTVTGMIPGVTFQLLSTSDTAVQVVIANYNSGVESSINTLVSDYNSLISAINTQEGTDSSGDAEPLYGSPTLTMLQQDILGGVNASNPSGYLTAISATDGTTLSGSVTIQTEDGFLLDSAVTAGTDATDSTSAVTSSATLSANEADTLSGSISIQVGSGTAQTVTLDSSDDTLAGLAEAINDTTGIGVTAEVTTTDGVSTLTLTSDTSGSSGSLTVTSSVRDTSAQTIDVPTTSGDNTLSGLASAINSAGIGVTAAVVTSDGESTLTLTSQTTGSSGALTVTSDVTATSDAALSATVTSGSSTVTSSATLTGISDESDTLAGSISIQVGSGTAHTITVDSSSDTLATLADAINDASIGVKASVVENTSGTYSLSLESETSGTAGTLTVSSSILDTTNTSTASLDYTSSSDIGSLSALGVSVNTDGTLSLDATTLDSVLNSDYSSVAGFFQNANSWGITFANMLTSAGSSSSTGILALAETANSSIESKLNAEITQENTLISAEQSSLTVELTSADEILQELPTELDEINELYSAITGYNSSSSS